CLFPYTTLFRSVDGAARTGDPRARGGGGRSEDRPAGGGRPRRGGSGRHRPGLTGATRREGATMTALTSPTTSRRRGRSLGRRQAIWAYIFAAPAPLPIAVWTGVPIVVAFVLSLTNYAMLNPPQFIGVANFVVLAGDP